DLEHRLAEERGAALLLYLEERPLDRADRRRRDIAVAGAKLRSIVGGKLQHRAQVFEVEQQEPVIVGNLEDEREHALLCRVQVEQATEQQRTEIRNRRTHRIPAPSEDVPERDGRRTPRRL